MIKPFNLEEMCSQIECEPFSNKSKYFTDIITFDIESTSYSKEISFMYVWQISINGNTYYGRHWDEFIEFVNYLKKFNKVFIIWIENLSFEFRFIEKLFDWKQVFATDPHKVIYAKTDNILFRCAYYMSGLSLEKIATNFDLPIKKLVGDLDYKLVRHAETPLTEKELEYCENDVLILHYYIEYMLDTYGNFTNENMPLTSTGFARKFVRSKAIKDKKYKQMRNIVKESSPTDLELYNLFLRTFAGGYVHANFIYSKITLENVRSKDKTSFYPSIMIKEKFPRKFIKMKSERYFNLIEKGYAVIADVCFINLKAKTSQTIISQHKCAYLKNDTIDNGRVYSADILVTSITELDYDSIKKFYTFDKITIGRCYASKKRRLPKTLIECILKLYSDKTVLKDVEGMETEYLRLKGLLNSLFGMCVTNIMQDMIIYNKGDWSKKSPSDIAIENNLEPNQPLIDYIENTKSILLYQTGIYVTAYARHELLEYNYVIDNDVVYDDTDSVKYLNYEKYEKFFNEYDEKVKEQLIQACKELKIDEKLLNPCDKYGKHHFLGMMSDEGNYTRFKTLGCKRYIYEKNGKLNATVAGVQKKKMVEYLNKFENPFNAFNNQLHIKEGESGKNTHYYTEPQGYIKIIDYLGNEYNQFTTTGISLIPQPFEINLSAMYKSFLSSHISIDGISHMERQNNTNNFTKVGTLWD